MEAILEATGARHVRQERSAADAPQRARCPAVRLAARRRRRSAGDGDRGRARRRCSKILHSESGANTLDLAEDGWRGRQRGCSSKDYQLDPVTHQVLHADFYRDRDGHACCRSPIPVIVKGEPKGVKQQGGILEFIQPRDRDRVPARPTFPEHVEVDVSELMLHQGIRVRDMRDQPEVEADQRRWT